MLTSLASDYVHRECAVATVVTVRPQHSPELFVKQTDVPAGAPWQSPTRNVLLWAGVEFFQSLVVHMKTLFQQLWTEDQGQDIAEYAVMLAVILVLVVGTIRLVGSNANNAFSSVASSLQ